MPEPVPQHWIQAPRQPTWDDLPDFILESFGVPKEQLGEGYSSYISLFAALEHYEDARRCLILSQTS